MIKVQSICKSFGEKVVLNKFSSTFKKGKINLIIGKSGSGKTMTIKCMLGLHTIDSGSIFFNDQDFTVLSEYEKKELRKEIGVVFQGSALFDSMTIEENVMFPLLMLSEMSMSQMKERVYFCLKRVDLDGVYNLYPSELSGGMKKRVAIARSIVLNPKYLFCDEPNSGLDPTTATVIDNLLKEITYEYNITTIINTHDMNSVIEIGDNVIFIQDGQKIWSGSGDSFLNSESKQLNEFIFSSRLFQKLKSIK